MVRTRTGNIVLWPTYFDITKTREQGRRIPKGLALDNPKADDIFQAVKRLGHKARLEEDKSHPGSPGGYEGRVLVEKGASPVKKTELIKQVARNLKK